MLHSIRSEENVPADGCGDEKLDRLSALRVSEDNYYKASQEWWSKVAYPLEDSAAPEDHHL